MRVSTREDDSGYTARACNYRVYLDGKKLKHCHTADEEKGEAHCFAHDGDGRPVCVLGGGGVIETEIKYGKVEVVELEKHTRKKSKLRGVAIFDAQNKAFFWGFFITFSVSMLIERVINA